VAVNCGALPDSLIESELFGYVKGAFTGATKTKKGRFELAHGGTLFLDEIGDISPLMQVKLLRAIQTYTIERLGDDKQIRVDIRIISATNKDLKEEIKKGNFREDLFYRLSVIPIEVPPLRERREDIPLLVKHFIDNFSSEFNISKPSISREAMEILKSYNWPGNVRELQNVIQYALVESQSSGKPIIEPCNLPSYLLEHCVSHEMMVPLKANLGVKKKKDIDLQTINEAIKKAKGNKSKAAKLLGISRATLYRILSRYEKNNMPIIK
jgi:transcriptional regulator with PAS, ATPase and Fis domain